MTAGLLTARDPVSTPPPHSQASQALPVVPTRLVLPSGPLPSPGKCFNQLHVLLHFLPHHLREDLLDSPPLHATLADMVHPSH